VTTDLRPRVSVGVDLTESTLVEAHMARRTSGRPVAVVDIGGSGPGSVRLSGSPAALRALAAAVLDAARQAAHG
jgi:hypothetical protein